MCELVWGVWCFMPILCFWVGVEVLGSSIFASLTFGGLNWSNVSIIVFIFIVFVCMLGRFMSTELTASSDIALRLVSMLDGVICSRRSFHPIISMLCAF